MDHRIPTFDHPSPEDDMDAPTLLLADVARLADWCDHLLHDHSCDRESYEELMAAQERVRAALSADPEAAKPLDVDERAELEALRRVAKALFASLENEGAALLAESGK